MNNQDFQKTLGLKVINISSDYAETYVEFDVSLQNIYKMFHGGVYFSLADSTAGMAAMSNGEYFVTANASIHYMVAVRQGKLTAKAKVINRAGKLAIVDVDIFDDESQLVNKSTFTMYKIQI